MIAESGGRSFPSSSKLPRLGGRKLVFLGKLGGTLQDALRPACESVRLRTAGFGWVGGAGLGASVAPIQQAFHPVQRQREGWQLVAALLCTRAGG